MYALSSESAKQPWLKMLTSLSGLKGLKRASTAAKWAKTPSTKPAGARSTIFTVIGIPIRMRVSRVMTGAYTINRPLGAGLRSSSADRRRWLASRRRLHQPGCLAS